MNRTCRHCGVRAFARGNVPEIGGACVSVKLNCLDGRDDRWWEPPAETRHL